VSNHGGSDVYHRLNRTVAFKVYSDRTDDGVLHLSPTLEVLPE
jgi:hypothetical protein